MPGMGISLSRRSSSRWCLRNGFIKHIQLFSWVRTILMLQNQSKKFVSINFSFSMSDRKMLFDALLAIYNFKIYKISIMKITYLIWPLIKYAPTILLKSNDLQTLDSENPVRSFSSGLKSLFHLVLSQRGLYSKLSYLGRNISNCILYNFQINWVNKSYSSLSYRYFSIIASKFILILLKSRVNSVLPPCNICHFRFYTL